MSGSKRARNSASLVNRTNVCGGPKKGGLGPSVGVGNIFTMRAIQRRATSSVVFSLTCPASYKNYRGGCGVGGIGRMATQGRRNC
jgi:hypothetical protein